MELLPAVVIAVVLLSFGALIVWLRKHGDYETPEIRQWRELREWGTQTTRDLNGGERKKKDGTCLVKKKWRANIP